MARLLKGYLERKISLWLLIKTHHTKTLVFLSGLKTSPLRLRNLLRHAPRHAASPPARQAKARDSIYKRFTSTSHAVLFATDIAARGLDFPGVDWVLQVDAPKDAEMYVHRVRRTARYESKGRVLPFLAPSEEEGMMSALWRKGIEVARIKIECTDSTQILFPYCNKAFYHRYQFHNKKKKSTHCLIKTTTTLCFCCQRRDGTSRLFLEFFFPLRDSSLHFSVVWTACGGVIGAHASNS